MMPWHSSTEDDYRRELLIFILIAANEGHRFDNPQFDAMVKHFVTTFEQRSGKAEGDLGFFFNPIHETSKEANKALFKAVRSGLICYPDEQMHYWAIGADLWLERLLRSYNTSRTGTSLCPLSEEEILLAKEVASETVEELAWGRIKPTYEILKH